MISDPRRLFLWSGLIWYGALRAYWVSLVVRITITLELPSLQLVLLGTAMEAALLVSEVPTGVVADSYSRKWSVVVGFVLVGAAQILAGLAETFPVLVATQVLWGVAYTFRSGADTAWVTDELGGPELVEELILRRARLQQLVAVVSIAAGAGLARFTSLTTSIVVSGLVLMITGAILAVTMPERGFVPSHDRSSRWRDFAGTLTQGARVVSGSRSLRVLVVVLLLVGIGGEAVDRLDIRRLDNLGLSSDLDEVVIVGIIAVAESLFGAAVIWWSRNHLVGRQVPAGLAIALAASAIGIAALGLVAVLPVAAVGLVFQGGLRQAAQPLPLMWTNAHAPSEVRATVLSFVEQASSVGEIGGGVMLGAVAAATTVPTAMACSVAVVLAAAFVASAGTRFWQPVEPVGLET